MVVHLTSLLTLTLTLICISLCSLVTTSQLDYDTLVFKQCDSLETNIILQSTSTTTNYPNHSDQNLFLRAQALSSFLRKLESESSRSKFFKTLVGNQGHAVSGWFQCREDYPSEICHRCVIDLGETSTRLCGNATSARVHLQGCHLNYEIERVGALSAEANNHHNFKLFEIPKHGLLHKICDGGTAETYLEFEEIRTKALTAAETEVTDGHGFYENSYKHLHVVAQCDGHVEPCDCGECVAAAAAAAVEECRWSIAGQFYLEGCYLAYTYYPHESPDDSYHEEGTSKENTGKSLAIVVGVVGAFVFIAIFFMLLKSFRQKGDDC